MCCEVLGTQAENRWVFKRVFVGDGNFTADHVQQLLSEDGFWLWDGAGMMPNQHEYIEFIKTAIECNTVSLEHENLFIFSQIVGFQKVPCENQFCAIKQALLSSKACNITGIVAIACAHHGCFAPNAIVNLFKGEQQKNVDWAFLKALEHTCVNPDQGATFLYDLMC